MRDLLPNASRYICVLSIHVLFMNSYANLHVRSPNMLNLFTSMINDRLGLLMSGFDRMDLMMED